MKSKSYFQEILRWKYAWIFPYLVLFYLSIWQAFALLRIEDDGWKYLAMFSSFLFYILLAQIHQRILKVVLLVGLIFTFLFYPTPKMYGKADFSYVASLFYTNTGEASSYLSTIPFQVYWTLFLATCYNIILLFFNYKKFKIPFWWGLGVIGLLLVQPFYKFFTTNNEIKIPVGWTAISIVRMPLYYGKLMHEVNKQQIQIMEAAKHPDDWKLIDHTTRNLKDIFVLVLGESVRKDFMHCYGFTIPNTPFIDSSNRIQFDNFLSVGTHTVTSLSSMIAFADNYPDSKLYNNIVNLAIKAGFETYWISNQGYIGIYDSPISIIAETSDHYFRTTGGSYTTAKNDTLLLPIFKKVLRDKSKNPKFIVIHTRGSHPSACDRTGGKYSDFFVSKELSCYVQSIRNMDTFLSKIYLDLHKTKKEFQLVYMSDHGLRITDDLNLMHGKKDKEAFEVPLLLWGNDIKETQHIKSLRNGRYFMHLFADLNYLSVANFKDTFSFLSEVNRHNKASIVVSVSNFLMDWDTLQSNPIPQVLPNSVTFKK